MTPFSFLTRTAAILVSPFTRSTPAYDALCRFSLKLVKFSSVVQLRFFIEISKVQASFQ